MSALPELQRAFGAALRDEHAPTPDDIVGDAFDAAARLQIYRNNHRQSLRRALADCFPVVHRLVGDGFFAWMAHRYTEQHPPRAGNLHDFGAQLPGFLTTFEGADGYPWLVDMARLEWAMQEAYHAAGHAPMDVAGLAGVPAEHQERLRFKVHPAARLIESRWPLLRIVEVNQPGREDDEQVDLDSGGERILVSRPGIEVHTERLDPGAYALLQSLAAGAVLADACEHALATQPDLDLGACVQRLVTGGIVVGFELDH